MLSFDRFIFAGELKSLDLILVRPAQLVLLFAGDWVLPAERLLRIDKAVELYQILGRMRLRREVSYPPACISKNRTKILNHKGDLTVLAKLEERAQIDIQPLIAHTRAC